jgi:hypothetical protein
LINKTNNNESVAGKYKDWIIRDYPDSEYGKILKNPNYLNELSKASKKEEVFYQEIYNDFISKNYEKAITEIDKRIQVKDNPYLCKYYYMKALSIGYSKPDPNNLAAVEKALEDVLNNCDDEIVLNQTNATLDKLKNRQSVIDAKSGASTYIYASDSRHYFVLIFPNSAGSVNQAKTNVSDLNMSSFSTKNLEIKSSFIDENNQIISVKTFMDKDDAMDYYLTFKTNNNQVKKLKEYDYFVITDKNFSSLFLEKDIPAYLEFFKKNYLKK